MKIVETELDLFTTELLIEQLNASHIQRLFVVGDLHGCYDELMHELKRVNFNFTDNLLISVGDLIDRGKDSLKCLELVKQPWFKAIRGNHEQMCLEAKLAPEMINFHCKHGGEWLYKISSEKQQECLNLCLNLPIILEVNFKGKKYGFVHADIHLNDWQEFKKSIQRNDYFTNQNTSTIQSALWGKCRISHDKKYQAVVGVDEIYLGHTVVPRPTQIQNCFYIDTGIVFGNKLTLKELL